MADHRKQDETGLVEKTKVYVVSVPDRSALFFIIWTGGNVPARPYNKNRADRSGTETKVYVCFIAYLFSVVSGH